jgi:ADP-heptose:LPS heptosyltransferase
MIKAHSMGIGDILRSSAAWRAMKDQWPGVELHLLFLSRHAGYPSEDLISGHHLLCSAMFLSVREGAPYDKDVHKVANLKIWSQVWQVSKRIQPDLIIDFEWAGSRTSLVSWVARVASGGQNVGIAQFPLRSWFYNLASCSSVKFAQKNGLSEPFDYTWRDFVALSALGVERGQTAIELIASPDAIEKVKDLLPAKKDTLRVGLNIGCATVGASHKRMPLPLLAQYFRSWLALQPLEIVLTGAPDEYQINEDFIREMKFNGDEPTRMVNMAGQTDIRTLPALIDACDVFVSTDSGPYHMAVALRKPTLCWLMYAEVTSYHEHPWVRCLVNPTETLFLKMIGELSKKETSNSRCTPR